MTSSRPRLFGHRLAVHFLQAHHRETVSAPVHDAGGRGTRLAATVVRQGTWCAAPYRMCTPSARWARGPGACSHHLDAPRGDQLDRVVPPVSPTLATTVATGTPVGLEEGGGPRGGRQLSPISWKSRAASSARSLSRSASDRNTVPAHGQPGAGRRSGSWRRPARRWCRAHHLAGRTHLRAEQRVDPGEPGEGQDRLLDAHLSRFDGARSIPSARSATDVAPAMTRAATMATGTPVALATNGTVRLARGFASST